MSEEAEAQKGEVTSPESQSQVLLTLLLSNPGGSHLSAPLPSGAQREVLATYITPALGHMLPLDSW